MMEKSVVLIDAENVLRSWWAYCEEKKLTDKVDYLKLVEYLTKDTNLLRAYFYDAVQEAIPVKKKSFLQALEHKGIQLRTKVLKNRGLFCENCGTTTIKQTQKGVDVSLATDILRHGFQKSCDICIVVSGDEDYKDAMDLVKDRGIKIWVSAFKSSLSPEVKRTADKVIFLDDIFNHIKQ